MKKRIFTLILALLMIPCTCITGYATDYDAPGDVTVALTGDGYPTDEVLDLGTDESVVVIGYTLTLGAPHLAFKRQKTINKVWSPTDLDYTAEVVADYLYVLDDELSDYQIVNLVNRSNTELEISCNFAAKWSDWGDFSVDSILKSQGSKAESNIIPAATVGKTSPEYCFEIDTTGINALSQTEICDYFADNWNSSGSSGKSPIEFGTYTISIAANP